MPCPSNITYRNPRLIVDCASCFIAGKFLISGNVKVDDFKITEFTLSIKPSGFTATTEFDAFINAAYTDAELNDLLSNGERKASLISLSGSQDILEMAIPGAGLLVPNIFSLGMIASFETGFTMGVKGSLNLTAGVKTTLPDAARISLDLVDLSRSAATGFEGATAEPIFRANTGSARVDGSVFFRPKFALKAQIMSVGELSADVKVGLPQINTNAEAAFDEQGVCEGSAEKTGVKFQVGGVLNLVVALTAKLAGVQGKLLEKTLTSMELFKPVQKCLPINIQGPGVKSVAAASNSTLTQRAMRGSNRLFGRM